MRYLLAIGVALLGSGLAAAQEQPPQPPPPDQPPPTLIEAKKTVVVTWTLNDLEWDFKDVLSSYEPVSGVLVPSDGQAGWTFEIVRDLLPGEVILHKEMGGPFKVTMLNADRVPVAAEMRVVFEEITGKKGDRTRALFILPPPEVFAQVKTVRIERRTKVGFETPQSPVPAVQP